MGARFRMLMLVTTAVMPAFAVHAASKAPDPKLAVAIAECDKGAAVPLMGDDTMLPVHAGDLASLAYRDRPAFEHLQQACILALSSDPKDQRLQMQSLRLAVAGDKAMDAVSLPQLRTLAAANVAEAQYLIYKIFFRHRFNEDADSLGLDRQEAVDNLKAAAESGHIEALFELFLRYRNGHLVKRDQRLAWETGKAFLAAVASAKTLPDGMDRIAADLKVQLLALPIEQDGFTKAEQTTAFESLDAIVKAGTAKKTFPVIAYANAIRFGRGTDADPVAARSFLEQSMGRYPAAAAVLADMMAKGEGGPKDIDTAMVLLQLPDLAANAQAARIRADLLLSGEVVGRQKQVAIRVLAGAMNMESAIRLADLLVDEDRPFAEKDNLISILTEGAETGEPGAGVALARLKLSGNSTFSDLKGAHDLLVKLARDGDRAAIWLLAGIQYSGLNNPGTPGQRMFGDYDDAQIKALVVDGVAKREPEAYLLSARLARNGVVFRQDDKGAYAALINAANLGSVEAMVLLGNAYADGIGTPKDPRQRLFAWRMAASKGSLEARRKLARAFVFDGFDKLMTLDEGVTNTIVLSINDADSETGRPGGILGLKIPMSGMFGSRTMAAGPDAVGEAILNAFREAPSGLNDGFLVELGKALPDDIRLAMSKRLAADGFLKGRPSGAFDPAFRDGLASWVMAKGPYSSIRTPDVPGQQTADSTPSDGIDPAIVAKVRDAAFELAKQAKGDKDRIKAISMLQELARYGDLDPRWGLLRTYHDSNLVMKMVPAADITRYGLDILVTKAPGMDKPEFEFIFDITAIDQSGQIDAFGDAVLATLRDDKRLQDALVLGDIMHQFLFAPGACDAMLSAAKRARIDGMGSDGCDDQSRSALIEFARKAGETGKVAKTRAEAGKAILAIAKTL